MTTQKLPNDVPVGTYTWHLPFENALCQLPKDSIAELTLSTCYPNMFTCNSGECIPIANRCDVVYDCADKSDEKNCDPVILDSSYEKELIPITKDPSGIINPCTVYINVSVLAIPDIETINLEGVHFF